MTRKKYAFYIFIIFSLFMVEYTSVSSPSVYVVLYLLLLIVSKLRMSNCGLPSYYLIMLIVPIVNLFFLMKLLSMEPYPYTHKYEKIKNKILDGKMYKIN